MASLHRVLGLLLGLVALVLSLWTLWDLILMLSTQAAPMVVTDVPCCGRYFCSLLWNFFLLSLFVVQHSGMSCDAWKTFLNRVGVENHRLLFVLCSCVVLLLLVHQMSPLPGPLLWYFDPHEYPTLWLGVFLFHCAMWLVICAGAVAFEPLELVGLKQVDTQQEGAPPQPVDGRIYSRHLGVAAFVAILWLQMAMSVERCFLALSWTLYVLFGHRAHPSAIYVVKNK